jgi:alkylation response protein AidB-like acyl-CoA dehydrogenase
MNFDFSSDQYMLRDSVRRYLSDAWGPRKVRAALGAYSPELWRGLCELGLQTLMVPEAHGGAGLGLVDVSLVFEEFGTSLVPAPMAETILASHVIDRYGSKVQCGEWLPLIVEGQGRFALAHAEPGMGYTAADVQLRARRQKDTWTLEGKKILVAGASAATHFLVSARDDSGTVRLFVCGSAKELVSVRAHRAMDSSALLCEVDFALAVAQPLGESDGAQALAYLLDCAAFSAAIQMTGISGAALDLAVDYAKQRVQFDKPIGSFQAIKHKCADMLVALEGARSTAYYAAWGLGQDEQALAVSMAKATAGDACRLICNEALQIHGGVGFTWDFDIHFYLKRGKLLEYSFGDAAFHRERIASLVLDGPVPRPVTDSTVSATH